MSNEEDLKHINNIIAERFGKIEERITSAETIASLFENLLGAVEKEFNIPFVWISLMNHDTAAPLIDEVRSSDFLQNRFSIVSPELLEQILSGSMRPVLANKNLIPFYKLLPPCRKYFVKSVAIVPFALNGQIVGTWNNGDADGNRYEPDMKTDLIESLAGRLSRKLTQLVAEKQADSGPEGEGESSGVFHD